MKRQSYAQLTSNISLTEAILWRSYWKLAPKSSILPTGRPSKLWLQSGLESSDLPFSGRLRVGCASLEITSRKMLIHRNCVDLIAGPVLGCNSEEQVTLCSSLSNFVSILQQVAFDKSPSHLIDFGKAGLHFTVNFTDAVKCVLQKGLLSQLVPVIVTSCDNSQRLNYLL